MTAYCTLYRKASLLRGVESLGGVWRPTKGGPLGLLRRAGNRKVSTASPGLLLSNAAAGSGAQWCA